MKWKIMLVSSPTAVMTDDLWRPQPELPVFAVCGDQVLMRVVYYTNHVPLMDLWSSQGDRERETESETERETDR